MKEIIFNLSEYKDVLPDELKEQVFTQMSLITQMIAYPRSMQSEIDQLLGEYIDKGTFGEYESIIRPSIEGYKFAVYLHRNNYDTKTDKDKSLLKGHEKTYKKKHNVTTDAWRTIESDALRRLQTSDKLLPRTVHDEQVVHLLVQYADYLQSQVMLDEMRGGVYVGPELFTFFGRNKLVHPLTQEIMETIYDTHLLATISNVLQQSDTLIPECKIKDDLINYLTDPKDTPAQRQGKYEKAVAMFSADISLWHLFIRKIMPEIASQDHGDKTIEAFIQQKIEQ
ncbi:MAG: hypothetical protein Q8O99_05865 [bacterium]|nr:hypothetical protein [bacterium]